MLDSALARPVNLLASGEPDLADHAAAYASGIARNHPFLGGNKRTSLVAARSFLLLKGLPILPTEADRIGTWLALDAGDLTEAALAHRLRERLVEGGPG